jgi:hypothetical protein
MLNSLATIVLISALGIAGVLPPGGTFTDDDGHVLEGGIEAIAAEGITKGCNPPFNDRFCPDQVLTRGQIAAMMSRALDLPDTAIDFFTDDNGHILEGAVNRMAAAGITKGCNPPTNTLFCPNDTVTRAQAAGFFARGFSLPDSTTDHFVDDDGHVLEPGINKIADRGITKGCNPPANDRYCPEDGVTRAQAAGMFRRAMNLAAMVPPDRPPLGWELVAGGLDAPIQVLAPAGEDRLLVAEQEGRIRIVENGAVTGTFLDITGPVTYGGEKGLLSIALHPDYPVDRRIFAWYSGALQGGGSGNHTTYLVEYDIAADLESASSPRTVIAIDQPYSNHNGGDLGFGPDGYLYFSTGDGGSGNDPGGVSRNLDSLLGKMLRIDVDGAPPYDVPVDNPYVGKTGADEIWASGLRNPFRWSMHDGSLYIGDVGQSSREEVDAVPVTPVGYDFGWSRYEGTVCNPNDTDASCSTSGLTMPVAEYGRSVGWSITGGQVYSGPTVRSLAGFYLYADWGSGVIRAFRLLKGSAVESVDLTSELQRSGIVDFATDQNGELLVVSLFSGAVYRLIGG